MKNTHYSILVLTIIALFAQPSARADPPLFTEPYYEWLNDPKYVGLASPDEDSQSNKDSYISFSIGLGFMDNSELTSAFGLPVNANNISFDDGFNGSIALGKRSHNTRVELELSFKDNDVEEFTILGVQQTGSASISSLSVMANGFIDFRTGDPGVTTYLGAGIGFSVMDGEVAFPGFSDSDEDLVFAYQVFLGVSVAIDPGSFLTIGYRGWSTTEPKFGGLEFDSTFNHSIEVGIRFMF